MSFRREGERETEKEKEMGGALELTLMGYREVVGMEFPKEVES
jgi:hypothetical protein